MAITNSFKSAVSADDVRGIRIMMKDSLLIDPTFAEFKEMSRFASGVVGLYDEHDGRELNYDKTTWNDDYMDKLMVQVVGNFSHKRLDHLQEVVKHLRPVAATGTETAQSRERGYSEQQMPSKQSYSPSRSYQQQKRYDQRTGSYRGAKIVGGAALGGTIGGLAAEAVGISVIGGVAVGAFTGGVIVFAMINKGVIE